MSRRRYGAPAGGGGLGSMGFPPLARSAMILIGINVALWAVMLIMYRTAPATLNSILVIGALTPELVLDGYVHQIFTYMFIHDLNSPFHVLMNMLGVYFFAAPIEARYGLKRTIALAIGAGLAGGVMVMIFHGLALLVGLGGVATTLGFSGAAMGLLSAFCWLYPNREILLIVVPMRAKYLLVLVIALDVLWWVTPGSSVSLPAHLGGILLGTLVVTDAWMPQSLVMRLRYWKIRRELDKRQSKKGGGKKGKDDKVVNGPWLH